jgi:hypothetical protein
VVPARKPAASAARTDAIWIAGRGWSAEVLI